jgi:6-phosphogluconolactonase
VTSLSSTYRILRDASEVALFAARHVESAARRAIERAGRFSLVLAGGATPAPTYELIAARGSIDWQHVHVFWSDERCVPPDHPASNYSMAAATLFARGVPPRDNIHRVPAERGVVEGTAAYDDELAAFFAARQPGLMTQPAFDLVLLGMGSDGHTASLFPGGPGLISPSWAAPARAPFGVEPVERVTLTLAAIAAAAEVCFIVTGAAKRETVSRVLSQQRSDLPAARVTARGSVGWFLDREAGPGLPRPPDAPSSCTESP